VYRVHGYLTDTGVMRVQIHPPSPKRACNPRACAAASAKPPTAQRGGEMLSPLSNYHFRARERRQISALANPRRSLAWRVSLAAMRLSRERRKLSHTNARRYQYPKCAGAASSFRLIFSGVWYHERGEAETNWLMKEDSFWSLSRVKTSAGISW